MRRPSIRDTSLLNAAVRNGTSDALASIARMGGTTGGTVTGTLVAIIESPTWRAEVTIDGGTVWLPAQPGAYVVGGSVWVQVDGSRTPIRVLAPATEALADDEIAVALPGMLLDPEARARNAEVRQVLTDAQGELIAAAQLLEDIGADRGIEGVWEDVVVYKFLVSTDKIITKDVIATGAVTAPAINIVDIDPTTGYTFSQQPDGIRMWAGASDTGDPTISLVTSSAQRLAILGDNDEVVAGMDASGTVLGRTGSFDELYVDAVPFGEYTDGLPRGVIYNRFFGIGWTGLASEGGYAYIVFDCHPARQYRISVLVRGRNDDAGGMKYRLRYTSVNEGNPIVVPDLTSTMIQDFDTPAPHGETSFVHHRIVVDNFSPGGTVAKTVAVLLTAAPLSGGTTDVDNARFVVEDIGRMDSAESGGSYLNIGGGGSTGGGGTPETPVQTYTKRYYATDFRSFDTGGTAVAPPGSTGASYPTQGVSPFYPQSGLYESHIYFDSAAIQADIGSGTVLSARVRLRCAHTHSGSGGTLGLHLHGYDPPRPDAGTMIHLGDTHFSRGERRWLGVTHPGWADGTIRGIGLSSRGSSSSEYYLYVFGDDASSSDRPYLEITYER